MAGIKPIHAFHPVARKEVSIDLTSIAGGATSNLTETVKGARPGMVAVVQADLPAGLILHSARVSANNTVAYKVTNITASAIDPDATTFTFIVF